LDTSPARLRRIVWGFLVHDYLWPPPFLSEQDVTPWITERWKKKKRMEGLRMSIHRTAMPDHWSWFTTLSSCTRFSINFGIDWNRNETNNVQPKWQRSCDREKDSLLPSYIHDWNQMFSESPEESLDNNSCLWSAINSL
jgi:hypothetical protein